MEKTEEDKIREAAREIKRWCADADQCEGCEFYMETQFGFSCEMNEPYDWEV